MATPVLIIGKSGSGKSTSLRNCQNSDWNLIRVLNKPLPFKGKIDGWFTDDYQQVMKCLIASKADSTANVLTVFTPGTLPSSMHLAM